MHFLITNDVELYSIPMNKLDPGVADDVYKVGLPRLLDLYAKHDIETTFYFTGDFVEIKPEAVELVKDHGHEIGCHGYTHEINKAFDVLNYKEQVEHLTKAKKLIEDISGPIYAFKAPALRINEYTMKALEQTGFKIDSSVASQRFDGPLSFGSKKKLKWLFAPRCPYNPSYDSPFKRGDSSILEIPISAAIFPYIGTLMRISPAILRFVEKILFFESKITDKPVVFIFHPNECLDNTYSNIMDNNIERRTNNYLEYIFADKIRHDLKLRNLGKGSIKLMEDVIKRGKSYGFEYTSISNFARFHNKEKS